MVYTVTLNPALDYVIHIEDFQTGEINRTQREEIQFGGKGINVSTVLSRLGVENTALGFLAGFTGQALAEGLRKNGIQTDFIWLMEGLTRINVKIKAGEETELNGRGPVIPSAALDELFQKLDRLQSGDVLDLSGSIPASLPDDIYQQILRQLEGRGILTVVDAAGELLCAALSYRPFLIKPNHHELGEIFGQTPVTDQELTACAKKLQKQGAPERIGIYGRGGLPIAGRNRGLPPSGRPSRHGAKLCGGWGFHGGRIFGGLAENRRLRNRPPYGSRRRLRYRILRRTGHRGQGSGPVGCVESSRNFAGLVGKKMRLLQRCCRFRQK